MGKVNFLDHLHTQYRKTVRISFCYAEGFLGDAGLGECVKEDSGVRPSHAECVAPKWRRPKSLSVQCKDVHGHQWEFARISKACVNAFLPSWSSSLPLPRRQRSRRDQQPCPPLLPSAPPHHPADVRHAQRNGPPPQASGNTARRPVALPSRLPSARLLERDRHGRRLISAASNAVPNEGCKETRLLAKGPLKAQSVRCVHTAAVDLRGSSRRAPAQRDSGTQPSQVDWAGRVAARGRTTIASKRVMAGWS